MRLRIAAIVGLAIGTSHLSSARGQDAAKAFGSLEELKASYARQLVDLDRRRIADMTALAARQTGDEAAATYRELFQVAVARDLYADAEAAADRYLKSPTDDPRDHALAALVNVIAQANRGAYDQSMDDLTAFYQKMPPVPEAARRIDPTMAVALGEAYLQRLVRGGRYDLASKVCEMIVARRPEPEIRDHFNGRLARLGMIGKPAPAIVGRDVDGKLVSLADLKGKVVLVDFWATWCPPCIAALPDLKAAQAKYGKDGFAVLGINLDARRDGAADLPKIKSEVRQFLLNAGVSWPNVVLGASQKDDPDTAYGVEEIPANFLVDRSGRVVHLELAGPDLDKAIGRALQAK